MRPFILNLEMTTWGAGSTFGKTKSAECGIAHDEMILSEEESDEALFTCFDPVDAVPYVHSVVTKTPLRDSRGQSVKSLTSG